MTQEVLTATGQRPKYSVMNLKEFDPERHMSIDEAGKLVVSQADPDLPLEKLTEALSAGQIRKYTFNGTEYVDRLDVGRIYHKAPEARTGLTIERFFTDGKTNPFDTVGPYKKRRAEIKDFKTNEVIFEMDDAVFPESWNDHQLSIVAQKYFFKPDKKEYKDKLESKLGKPYEHDIRHLITRVTNFIADEGERLGYFATKADKEAFADELKCLQINRKLAFNSPVQFNAGIFNEYGVTGSPGLNFWRNPETGEVVKVENGSYIKPQSHACFINGPRDNLESIGQHVMDEISIFSSGSGVGQNIGLLRGSGERLSGGGKSSGSTTFGKLFDATGGIIKSGGKSRRAARMMTMRYHHPDIMSFIRDKVREDYKVKILIENGFSGGMDGEAATTVAYQNTNISVMLDNNFFEQVANGGKVQLIGVRDGSIIGEVSAKQMLEEIAYGSWRIGDPGVQYDSKMQEMHTVKNSGRINSSNPCSEYMSINDTSCNLASLNVLEFSDEKGKVDVKAYKRAAMTTSIALDIINDISSYPVREISHISPELRNIGLGYAGVGSLIMRRGIAYDSDEARSLVGALTSILTGAGYEQSALSAKNLGTFVHYEFNKRPMLEVMQKHKDNLEGINWRLVPDEFKEEAYETWNAVLENGKMFGFRNSQASAIAPTGTISYLLGSEDSTGIEPLISLGISKNLAGGGDLKIKNKELPNALKNLGYKDATIEKILKYVADNNAVIGAPELKTEHYAIFNTSLGNGHDLGAIAFNGHIRMIAAAQPFVSGAISKTCNMPESCTVKDIYDNLILGKELGIKAIAIFRDKSKPTFVYSMDDRDYTKPRRGQKEELPSPSNSQSWELTIGNSPSVHMTVREYNDGRIGQIAFMSYKGATTLGALLTTSGIQASDALKGGLSIERALKSWEGLRAEPSGMVQGDPNVKMAYSILDLAQKIIKLNYLGMTEYANTSEPDKPPKVKIEDLRGFKNGAFKAYRKLSVNDWDFATVMADPFLGGFVEAKGTDALLLKSANKSNGNGNDSGIPCVKCGNIMYQYAPNCFKCTNCGDGTGGCGI